MARPRARKRSRAVPATVNEFMEDLNARYPGLRAPVLGNPIDPDSNAGALWRMPVTDVNGQPGHVAKAKVVGKWEALPGVPLQGISVYLDERESSANRRQEGKKYDAVKKAA